MKKSVTLFVVLLIALLFAATSERKSTKELEKTASVEYKTDVNR